ncbi:trypsin-like [Lycorma delicatula]|uniref:trypsin-like n=1 Tax=Lycorma delicatula TaxID=130591 RepID=UPI003F51863F
MCSKSCIFIILFIKVFTLLSADANQTDTEVYSSEVTNLQGPLKIVGGYERKIEDIKYIASVLDNTGGPLGSATILNSLWLVTTASFEWLNPTYVRAGSNYNYDEGIRMKIDKFLVHPDYTTDKEYDIALIKLINSLTYSIKIRPISIALWLPKNKETALITGFGNIGPNRDGGFLKGLFLQYMDYDTCKGYYNWDSNFTQNSFCTYILNREGPCAYDWGSPLVYNNRLIGVLSTIYACSGSEVSGNNPPVYTDVTKFIDWIKKTIRFTP